MKKTFIVKTEAGERLDKFLSQKFSNFSRSQITKLIKGKDVLVNNNEAKPSYTVSNLDKITLCYNAPKNAELVPRKQKIEIIFENDDVIVINKKPGMVVHPAAGHSEDTLANALLAHFPEIREAVYDRDSAISRSRPGLVHRLDKDTSGVMIVAKTNKAMHSLSRQIQNRKVKKIYWAICSGWPKNKSGEIVSYLGRHPKNRKMITDVGKEKGKEAVSQYNVLENKQTISGDKFSLIEFDIKTGRTHQIRVQTLQIGYPVIGDVVYKTKLSTKISKELKATRQLLHAKSLSLHLPDKSTSITFEAPLPEDFLAILNTK